MKEGEDWEKHTTTNCAYHYFEGDHFFLNEKSEEVIDVVNRTLAKYAYQPI